MKKFLWAIFALYGAVMLHLLFARASLDDGGPYWQQVRENLNLKPLFTIRHQWRLLHLEKDWAVRSGVVNLYGNVIVFVPLGLGLPWLIKGLRCFWRTMLACTGIIVAVETAQLLTLRGFGDVDDLLLNLIGCAMGFIFFRIFVKEAEA